MERSLKTRLNNLCEPSFYSWLTGTLLSPLRPLMIDSDWEQQQPSLETIQSHKLPRSWLKPAVYSIRALDLATPSYFLL